MLERLWTYCVSSFKRKTAERNLFNSVTYSKIRRLLFTVDYVYTHLASVFNI